MNFPTTDKMPALAGGGTSGKGIEMDLETLKGQVREFFPADAASFDLSNPKEVILLTKELLERLWRWEN